jgi:hypothetical protein
MAKKDDVKRLREKSKSAAMEGLRPRSGLPVAPRKAMAQAKKASKRLAYPLAPYPNANPLQLSRWALAEWRGLGRWQGLALPVAVLVALTTWEKEKMAKEARQFELDRAETRQFAAQAYGAYGRPKTRRRFFGFIPLPGGRNS